jgi:hypothetical protein
MNGYENGKIYRLECNSLVYYGSTKQTLEERFRHHKGQGNKTSSTILFEIGDEVKIQLVEEYPCNSKRELELREQYYISTFECINSQNAFLTKDERKEYMINFFKDYYPSNTEKIIKRSHDYYHTNKELISQLSKERYEANKEKILKRRKELYQANKDAINQKRREKAKKIKDIM